MENLLRNFLYFLSFIFFANSIILVGRKSFTLGLAIMFCISAFLFIFSHWMDFWLGLTASGIGYYLRYIITVGMCIYLFLIGYVLFFAHSTATYSENAVIVLGCGLNRDGTPGPTLTKRLEGCIEYYNKNPDCYVVVSGSYSRFNNVTEGIAMKNYLLENNIPDEKILLDEKATNTRENFRYSMELLNQKNIPTENICYITNSFHVYRSGIYARQEGFAFPKAVSVSTDYAVFIPAVLREVYAVAAMMIFNY